MDQGSLVPRPLPVSNVAHKRQEVLVCEVTCTSFRWKGGGRVIVVRGPEISSSAQLELGQAQV